MEKDIWRVEDMRTKKEIGQYDNWDDAVLIMDTHFPARIVRVGDRAILRLAADYTLGERPAKELLRGKAPK
jgi:hypothetical protein